MTFGSSRVFRFRWMSLRWWRNGLIVALCSSCVMPKMPADEANLDLLLAYAYKQQECGSMPQLPLLVFDDTDKNALAGCVIAIISAPCPVTEYPFVCIRMYGKDVPGTVKVDRLTLKLVRL